MAVNGKSPSPVLTTFPTSLSVAFMDGNVVWSDFTNHSLVRADALNGSNKHILVPDTINEVMSLTIVHPSLQPQSNPFYLHLR